MQPLTRLCWSLPARSAGKQLEGVDMSRFITFAALAALMAGCSDATVAPKSLHPTAASFAGTPPPPPVTGDGRGSFFAGNDLAVAATVEPCVEATDTHYQFVYTTDQATEPGMNQVAHIKFDEDLSHQITIHQAPNEPAVVDAEGIIAGPGFSFRISSSQGGVLQPTDFQVAVTGILKTPAGSCETTAEFDGSLIVSPSP
jgi:hypothetical protein